MQNVSYWTISLIVAIVAGIVATVASHYIVQDSEEINNEPTNSVTDKQITNSPPIELETQESIPEPTQPVERTKFVGNVGNWQAYFDLTFNYQNNSVSGNYFYPKRPDVTYLLEGSFGQETLTLTEYTNGFITAECFLRKNGTGECYRGTMENTDGRKFDMNFCKD